jgi:YVTN family beta-propeller protein
VAVDPDTQSIYVVDSEVSLIDGGTRTVTATLPVCKPRSSPVAVAVDPGARIVYVMTYGGGVSMLNADTHAVTKTIEFEGPMAIAVDPVSHTSYVASNRGYVICDLDARAKMSVIHPGTRAVTATTMDIGRITKAMAVDPVTHAIYVVNWGAPGKVSVIDAATLKTTSTIRVGEWALGVAVDPGARTVYVANMGDNTVSVIDADTHTVTATIDVGDEPNGVAVDPGTHTVYTVNRRDDSVSVIAATS